jgi:hypothetical protein
MLGLRLSFVFMLRVTDGSIDPMDLTTWVSTAIKYVNHVRATLFDDGSNDPMDLTTRWIYQPGFRETPSAQVKVHQMTVCGMCVYMRAF